MPSNTIKMLEPAQISELLTILLRQSFESVIITDGDPLDHKILYANPQFCQMTGYTKDELIGQKPSIFGGAKTNPAVIQRLKKALVEARPFNGATTNYRKDGTEYHVSWNIYPLFGSDGKPEYFVSIQKDLSSLKHTLSRLKSSSDYFKHFLIELEEQKRGKKDESEKEAVTQILKDNVETMAEFVNHKATDEQEVLDDDLFFDFDDFSSDSAVDDSPKTKITATEFISTLNLAGDTKQDIISLANTLHNAIETFDLQEMRETERAEFVQDLQEMANAIFYIEEFMDVSVGLSELSVCLYHAMHKPFDLMIAEPLQGLVSDMYIWIDGVFVTQTSEDIHALDHSIISSCKQILVFARLKD